MEKDEFSLFFASDRIQKCRRNLSKPELHTNTLDSAQIGELLQLFAQQAYYSNNDGSLTSSVTGLEDYFSDLCSAHLNEELEVFGGFFFLSNQPYLAHVDSPSDHNEIPCKNILIPIQTIPEGHTSKIVFFEQRYFGPAANLIGPARGRKSKFVGSLSDYDKLDRSMQTEPGKTPSSVPNLDHHTDSELEGLTICSVFDWTAGSLICFDSSQVHCSTLFHNEGILAKTGVTLFARWVHSD